MSPQRAHDEASPEGEFKRCGSGVEKIVVIKIPSGEEFRIHAHLLVQHSDYFLRALNSGMAEASSLEFALEQYASRSSAAFLAAWMYGRSYLSGSDLLQNLLQARPQLDIEYFNLPEAWLLADYLHVRELQNDVMERLSSRRFALARILAQYGVHPPTPPGCMLFKFQCMLAAAALTDESMNIDKCAKFFSEQDPEVVAGIACYLAIRKGNILDEWTLESFLV